MYTPCTSRQISCNEDSKNVIKESGDSGVESSGSNDGASGSSGGSFDDGFPNSSGLNGINVHKVSGESGDEDLLHADVPAEDSSTMTDSSTYSK